MTKPLTYSIAFEIDNKTGRTTAKCLGVEFTAARGEPLIARIGDFEAYVSRSFFPGSNGSTASIRRLLKTTSERVASKEFRFENEAIHFAASWLKERA